MRPLRILFLVHNLGKTRHFESVILGLTRRRHTVVLAAARKRRPLKPTTVFHGNKWIEVIACPTRRVDRWASVAEPMRRARDYLRFLDPRYVHATKLAARAAECAPEGWTAIFARRPWLRRHGRAAQRALELAEAAMPSDPYFDLFVKAEQPDLVLITPLVDFGSYQTDYVKAAHRLGVPVAFLPFSWDNLTNRGLVRVAPDRVLVWNEHQKREAVDLHGVPADRVVITGAPRFDEFFAMSPATTRDQFCAKVGLDASRLLLLYVCSSQFVAPREVEFVRQWINELRRSAEPALRTSAVLVRPHPAHQDQWSAAELSEPGGVALWSEKSRMNADQGLYDSLHHAAAVVGLNTSAMIEAAIVGRPVHTIAAPEFAGGQGGTLHFWYLLSDHGGIVSLSETFAEHFAQMADAVRDAPAIGERCRRFVEAFVRPHGLDVPATGIMVAEIERAGTIRKRPQPFASVALPGALEPAGDPALARPRPLVVVASAFGQTLQCVVGLAFQADLQRRRRGGSWGPPSGGPSARTVHDQIPS